MFERLKAMLFKEFRQVLRDKRMKVTMFVAPIFQILIFGYAATTDVKNIPTAIYDLDNTYQSRDIIRDFVGSKYFRAKYYIYSDKELNTLINESAVNAVLCFDHGFAQKLNNGGDAQIQLILDGTDSSTASVVLSYASAIIRNHSQKEFNKRINILPINVKNLPSID